MASQGPLKCAVSAQKALKGSETETRELLGGMEGNRFSPQRNFFFTCYVIFYKKETEKN